jgi:hypothetical protein
VPTTSIVVPLSVIADDATGSTRTSSIALVVRAATPG